jgi:hypothetical protein
MPPRVWGISPNMPIEPLARLSAAFADLRHAHRAMTVLTAATDLPMRIMVREGDMPLAVVDIDVTAEHRPRLEALVRMTGGTPLPAAG